MSKRNRKYSSRPIGRNRRFSVRAELRREPDLSKIAKAVVALALAQAEAEAQADNDGKPRSSDQPATPPESGDTDARSAS